MATAPAFLCSHHNRTFFLFGESLLFPNIFMYGTLDRAKTFSSCLRAFLSKQIRIVRFLSLFLGIYVIMLCNISVLLLTAFGRLPTAANAVCDGSRLVMNLGLFQDRSGLSRGCGGVFACTLCALDSRPERFCWGHHAGGSPGFHPRQRRPVRHTPKADHPKTPESHPLLRVQQAGSFAG